MKHWTPRIADAAEARARGGRRRVVGLVLAPHYSRLSIAGYREQLEQALAGRAELALRRQLARRARLRRRSSPTASAARDAHVVFTAHSLPARILDEGDPYQDQLLETARLVADAAGVERLVVLVPERVADRRAVARPGHPRPPRRACTHAGVDDVLVCPVGFVSDHLEIRWDIDVEAQERARELGLRLERIEMPNADPAFVRALAAIVRRALAVPSRA